MGRVEATVATGAGIRVLACLQKRKLASLQHALDRRGMVTNACGSDQFLQRALHTAFDVALFDPEAGENITAVSRCRSLLADYVRASHAPLFVYADFARHTKETIVELIRAGARGLIVAGIDDEPRELLRQLEVGVGFSQRALLIRRIADLLPGLPSGVEYAIRSVLSGDLHVDDVGDLARLSNVSRRTLDRAFYAAGLSTPRRLIQGARVLEAYILLRGSARVAQVGALAGFHDYNGFRTATELVAGVSPTVLASRIQPETLCALLASHLRRATRVSDPAIENSCRYDRQQLRLPNTYLPI